MDADASNQLLADGWREKALLLGGQKDLGHGSVVHLEVDIDDGSDLGPRRDPSGHDLEAIHHLQKDLRRWLPPMRLQLPFPFDGPIVLNLFIGDEKVEEGALHSI